MKLRNKKTGEIFDAIIREKRGGNTYSIIVCNIEEYSKPPLARCILGEYDSLAELNEEWEDYTPAEPLIKDEKIRKAVRAWAEAEKVTTIKCYQNSRCCEFYYENMEQDVYSEIKFIGGSIIDKSLNNKIYTIAELCGEEEE